METRRKANDPMNLPDHLPKKKHATSTLLLRERMGPWLHAVGKMMKAEVMVVMVVVAGGCWLLPAACWLVADSGGLVGACCLVVADWCLVRVAWCLVRGAWRVVLDGWCPVLGVWCVVPGAQ